MLHVWVSILIHIECLLIAKVSVGGDMVYLILLSTPFDKQSLCIIVALLPSKPTLSGEEYRQ